MTGAEEFAARLAAGLAGYGHQPFIEFDGRWYSGNEIAAMHRDIEELLHRNGIHPGDPIGVVVRNRVPHAAAILGFIASARPVVMIYSYQSPAAIAADITRLQLPAVIADQQDWTEPTVTAAKAARSAAISLSLDEIRCVVERIAEGRPDAALAQPGVHILTSGTTGAPKRIPIPTAVLQHTVNSITHASPPDPDGPPDVVFWPFGSVGLCQLLAAPFVGKRMVLLERFTVADWVSAVRTYRIRRSGVQPAIVRMLLDAPDVTAADLSSLEFIVGGSGPLEPATRAEFERRFGIPVLWAYGATEFAGSVCSWTPDLYRQYGASKPDSSGLPLPGVQVRIVDPESGDELPVGSPGLLEARVEVMGPDWIRTTDVASVDTDGFLTIHGRSDGAINRGGFKILPETVRRTLLTHPAVLDACVVGVPDRRLGQVPFAAVELRSGANKPTEADLQDLVREALPSHHVPVAIAVVDVLPRNAAMKVIPDEVAALYE
ncbi:fatty acid--CoA ligase family protein [Mycobacterium sp. OTB74]|uniref:class I adenylate-forming enzyme family protein n=1 Tax=Mycobacterium sp. OTB74 TaxID=1853452 RepID=UPI002473E98D|nr:fatty acid--CoA ligase family protein [Mycobacterium sp. OTB74]MDH6242783.1 long-chain acyl-CoA synthetase [Mycobacterium sp. OTB74]